MGLLSKAAVKTGPGPGNTEQKIREYHKNHPAFQGMVLKFPRNDTISRAVSAFGAVLSLSPENSLVLIPGDVDRELLAHRLSKTLKAQVLYQFQADDPGQALSLLAPYW
jgi:hypothetical protein